MRRPSPVLLAALVAATTATCKPRYPRDFDGDGYFSHVDCDDTDPEVHLFAQEIPFDGKDNDCDPSTLDDDFDGDGLPASEDCYDDNPLLPTEEVYYDGLDNDCDPETADRDQDGDGIPLENDCDDTDPLAGGADHEIPTNGMDDDCDPTTPDVDGDGDGVETSEDCDDTDPAIGAQTRWFVDCDGDGFAEPGALFLDRCAFPDPPALCIGSAATWTDVEPVHGPNTADNTTTDCNDNYEDVFPGQTEFFASPAWYDAPLGHDYDCNGIHEPEHGLLVCSSTAVAGVCSAQPGFLTDTACGTVGTYTDSCAGTPCDWSEPTTQEMQRCR